MAINGARDRKNLGIHIETKKSSSGLQIKLWVMSGSDYSLFMSALQPKFMAEVNQTEARGDAYAKQALEEYGDDIFKKPLESNRQDYGLERYLLDTFISNN